MRVFSCTDKLSNNWWPRVGCLEELAQQSSWKQSNWDVRDSLEARIGEESVKTFWTLDLRFHIHGLSPE